MKSLYEATDLLDPAAVAAMEADFNNRCRYRLFAADSSVPNGHLYVDATNPPTFNVGTAADENIYARGHAMWVTGHGAAVAEAEALRTNSLDDDGDGLADDGYTALDSSRAYAIVRQGNSPALLTQVRNPLKEFMVYDYLGQPLWIVSKNSNEAPPAAFGTWPHANDIILTKKGLSERLANIDNTDDAAIGQFTDGLDYDSDGIPDDTAVYQKLNPPHDPSSLDDDDDGIANTDEQAGAIPGGREVTDPNDPHSPLRNRALDLTFPGESYAEVANFSGPDMANGFTIELWYKMHANNLLTTGALLSKTAAGGMGDFWFGFEDGFLTLKYRNVAGTSSASTFNARRFTDPKLGWVHVAASVKEDTTHPEGAARVSFVVYADGLEYSSESMQILGVTNINAAKMDDANEAGELIFGTKGAEGIRLTMDEVRVWNGVRTHSQVTSARNYVLTSGNADWASLRAYFRFDDGGISAWDSTKTDASATGPANASRRGGARFADVIIESSCEGQETYTYLYGDSDNDKIPDFWEIRFLGNLTTAGPGDVDHYTDTDGDGLNDYYEYRLGRHPLEVDDPAIYDIDADGDTLTVLQEQKFGSDPNRPDSDDDGVNDNFEIAAWNSALHSQVTNPNYSVAHWNGTTTTPNLALDLAKLAPAVPGGLKLPKTGRFVSATVLSALKTWFKANSAASGTLMRLYNTKKNDGTADNTTILALRVAGGKAVAESNGSAATAVVPLVTGEWQHLCAVLDYEKKKVAIIVDGMAIVEAEVTNLPACGYLNEPAMTVGGNGITSFADGLLDEVKVFTGARAITAVSAQRFLAADQQTIGLAAYYRFDDEGYTIEDFTHPFPAALGDNPAAYALAHPADPTQKTSDWLSASDVPVANDLPGTIPNWWAEMYRSAAQLGVTEFAGHYYEVVTQKLTWDASKAAAEAAGGTLAIIGSAAENDFLASNMLSGRRGIWLGLTDEKVEGEFVWIDGTPLAGNYSNWSTGEPNNGVYGGVGNSPEDYVFLVGAGKINPSLAVGYWNDAANDEQHNDQDSYIIEYRNYLNYRNNAAADWDGDGLSNWYEYLAGTNPLEADTDGDNISDGGEKFAAYPLTNWEAAQAGTYIVNDANADTDNDGVSDADEIAAGTNPVNSLDPRKFRALNLAFVTDYLALPQNLDYALTTMTLAGWIKPVVGGGGAVLTRQVAANEYNYRLMLNDDGTLTLTITHTAGTTVNFRSDAVSVIPLDGETWSHIAVTVAENALNSNFFDVKFYIGGEEVALDAAHAQNPLPTAPRIYSAGPVYTRIGEGFLGQVYNFAFWETARSAAEIAADMSMNNITGAPAGLVAFFAFDDGGDTVENFVHSQDWLTGWANAATLSGATIEEITNLPIDGNDTDGDGLPDWWEILYGLDPISPLGDDGADGDPDDDGLTNLYEYYAGTNPRMRTRMAMAVLTVTRTR